MAPSRTSGRENNCTPATPMAWKLPRDLLLEIIARSDLRTLIRCAATCKLLRREILAPPLDRRFTHAAPCVLAYLWNDAKNALALLHPIAPAASNFSYKQLSRFVSSSFAALLDTYEPVSSRRGLVVLLRRQGIEKRPMSDRSDLCVYDPMSGAQTFFSNPPAIRSKQHCDTKYVVLTAADGIGSSFQLLAFDLHRERIIRVHATSSCGTMATLRHVRIQDILWESLKERGDPAVLIGGVIHWLPSHGDNIPSFDLSARKIGSVKLPPAHCDVTHDGHQLYLATSSDRKLLKLLAIEGFKMFVWLQLPAAAAAGSDWSLETVIDMEEKLCSLNPPITGGPGKRIDFEGYGKSNGEVVFLVEVWEENYEDIYSHALIVFDLETKNMCRRMPGLSLLEIDLKSRLQTMKIFS